MMPTDIDAEMLKDIHSARGEMYAFLSRMFSNVPNEDFLRMLNEMYAKLEQLETENQDINGGKGGIKAFLSERNSLAGDELREFDLITSRHYTMLFCLPSSVPTDESLYSPEGSKNRFEAYDKMVALHKKYGIEKTRSIPENDDFVSYELQFMSKLAYAAAANIKDAEKYGLFMDEQFCFHKEHLDKWIYDFFFRVRNAEVKGERLYTHIAQLASGFIKEDKLMLEELTHP